MRVDSRNLQIKLVRGRTQTMVLRIGSWSANPPPPGGRTSWNFVPINITGWWFSFTMRSNYTYKQPAIAVSYNPIANAADPTQGQLMWNILGKDTEPLPVDTYVFDMTVTQNDKLPRFFCGGIVPLFDNVTDIVNIPA
jgi:hypothetical protein